MDMMVNSFTFLVVNKPLGSYSRPEFTENGPVAIEAGRHPIVEYAGSDEFVANSTFLSEASNMVIVTGPNMSGKSTYICQVALITILAHIGCYVPAKFASFRIVDRLFTRIGTRDSIGSNSSTFMTEMRETAFLIQNLTSRSFIFIDELGRATSSSDGLAIAWSCCEYLLSLRAYVIFATHMQRLVELASIYPNVKICHFSAAITNNRLDFKFVLKEGCTHIPHYGLLLAGVAGLPPSVIEEAKEITEALDKEESNRFDQGYSMYLPLRKDYHVAQRILCLKYANLGDEDLRPYLQNLKENYLDGEFQ